MYREVKDEFEPLFPPVNCRCSFEPVILEEENMKLRFEKTRFSDEFGKKYYIEDETDMEILCQDVNEQITLLEFKVKSLEAKVEAVKRIVGDDV